MNFPSEPNINIVLLNLGKTEVTLPGFSSIVGDVRYMNAFADGQFDVVFSNSVIEHVGSYKHQKEMANEIRRVGKRFFLQTPNRYFPIEPYFIFLFFQFLPLKTRAFLIRHYALGWYSKIPNRQRARDAACEIRLLTGRQLRELFPGSSIYRERFCGLTKSFIVCGQWST
jgi:hypothetical protein